MRLLRESYVALGRYERRLQEPSDELEVVRDLKMGLEPALDAGVGEVVCPARARFYHQHPADAGANSRVGSCGDCLAEGVAGEGPPDTLLAERPAWMLRPPIVLSRCRECRTNATAAESDEAGALVCSGCLP